MSRPNYPQGSSIRPRRVRLSISRFAVMGGGQAGLAMGYYLREQGLGSRSSNGAIRSAAWRERWDSLILFTPRRYGGLPGLPFPGDPDGYPEARRGHRLSRALCGDLRAPDPAQQPRAQSLSRRRASASSSTSDGRTIKADQVVVATGPSRPQMCPRSPRTSRRTSVQVHSTGYRRPSDVPEGTGRGRRRRQHRIPDRQGAVGYAHGSALRSALGRRRCRSGARTRSLLVADEDGTHQEDRRVAARATAARPGHADRLEPTGAQAPLRRRGQAAGVGASGRTVTFEDGSELEVDAVIWATGYRSDYGWIDVPVFDSERPRAPSTRSHRLSRSVTSSA